MDYNSLPAMTGTGARQQSIELWDTLLRALAAEPRRQLILSLTDSPPGESVALPEAANRSPPQREPELLYRELIHSHLPTLEQAGLIEWEREPLSARRGRRFEEAAAIVAVVQSHADELPQSLQDRCESGHVH